MPRAQVCARSLQRPRHCYRFRPPRTPSLPSYARPLSCEIPKSPRIAGSSTVSRCSSSSAGAQRRGCGPQPPPSVWLFAASSLARAAAWGAQQGPHPTRLCAVRPDRSPGAYQRVQGSNAGECAAGRQGWADPWDGRRCHAPLPSQGKAASLPRLLGRPPSSPGFTSDLLAHCSASLATALLSTLTTTFLGMAALGFAALRLGGRV